MGSVPKIYKLRNTFQVSLVTVESMTKTTMLKIDMKIP